MSGTAVLAWGVFASVPVVGGWLWPGGGGGGSRLSLLVRHCAAGAAAWSALLLLAIEGGFLRPAALGALGWILTLAGLAKAGPAVMRSLRDFRLPPLPETAFFVLLAAFSAVNGLFACQHILGGRDMGVYVNTAVFAERTGGIAVAYPVEAQDRERLLSPFFGAGRGKNIPPFPGLHPRSADMVPQFSHLYPAWLAQAYAAGGPRAMFALNPAVGLLSLLAFAGLCGRFVRRPVAAAATLLLAADPGQIWLSRITMTEVLAQFFLLAALDGLAGYLGEEGWLSGLWAGLLVAAATLVRIDSLAVIPLALAGLGALRFLGDPPSVPARPLRWGVFAASAVPAGALAVAYYWFRCRAYLLDTLSLTLLSAGAAGVVLLLFVPLPPKARAGLTRWASSPAALWALAVVLGALFAYALLLRPHAEPFATWDFPGQHPFDGLRDHREDSLVNLLAYLTPLLPPLALLGALGLFQRLQRSRVRPEVAPLLTVFAGVTLAFLYRPAIDAHHIWAFRRFVPVAVPGVLLLAGVGATVAWGALAPRGRKVLAAAFALCLVGLAGWTGYAFFVNPEYQGLYPQVEALARDARGRGYLFARSQGGWGLWETPLFLAFGLPVLPLDATNPEQARLLADQVERERGAGRPLRLAWEGGLPPQGLDLLPVADHTLTYSRHVPTLEPPPFRWETVNTRVLLFEVDRVSLLDRVLGGAPLLRLPGGGESGFWPPEYRKGAPAGRWTRGRSELVLPLPRGAAPQRLQLYLRSARPGSCRLEVSAQGKRLLERELPPGSWYGDLPFDVAFSGEDPLRIELTTDTWVPSQTNPASRDTRELGVFLEGVRLATSPFGPPGETLPPSAARSALRRMGEKTPATTSEREPGLLLLWVKNAGDRPWPSVRESGSAKGAVRLGAKWYALDDPASCRGESRADLPYGLYPGEGLPASLLLRPVKPGGGTLPPGRYRVVVGLLQEGVHWFSGSGDGTLETEVEVLP